MSLYKEGLLSELLGLVVLVAAVLALLALAALAMRHNITPVFPKG